MTERAAVTEDHRKLAREWVGKVMVTGSVAAKFDTEPVAQLLADALEAERERVLEEAAQHWPIGELGTLTDFRCSCGATLASEPDSASRIAAWKVHIRALAAAPRASGSERET